MATPSDGGGDDARQASLTSLEAEFPGWRIWQPPGGRSWWATRRGSAWALPRSVAADTEDELRTALRALTGGTAAASETARPARTLCTPI
jgi:hypothetical protein